MLGVAIAASSVVGKAVAVATNAARTSAKNEVFIVVNCQRLALLKIWVLEFEQRYRLAFQHERTVIIYSEEKQRSQHVKQCVSQFLRLAAEYRGR